MCGHRYRTYTSNRDYTTAIDSGSPSGSVTRWSDTTTHVGTFHYIFHTGSRCPTTGYTDLGRSGVGTDPEDTSFYVSRYSTVDSKSRVWTSTSSETSGTVPLPRVRRTTDHRSGVMSTSRARPHRPWSLTGTHNLVSTLPPATPAIYTTKTRHRGYPSYPGVSDDPGPSVDSNGRSDVDSRTCIGGRIGCY